MVAVPLADPRELPATVIVEPGLAELGVTLEISGVVGVPDNNSKDVRCVTERVTVTIPPVTVTVPPGSPALTPASTHLRLTGS